MAKKLSYAGPVACAARFVAEGVLHKMHGRAVQWIESIVSINSVLDDGAKVVLTVGGTYVLDRETFSVSCWIHFERSEDGSVYRYASYQGQCFLMVDSRSQIYNHENGCEDGSLIVEFAEDIRFLANELPENDC